jgi:hypothetical protein
MPKTNEEVEAKTLEIMNDILQWSSSDKRTLTADETSTMLAMVTEMLFSMLETTYKLTQKEAEQMHNEVMAVIVRCLGGKTAPLPGYL